GTTERIASRDATNGAPILHLAPPRRETPHSLIVAQFDQLKQGAKDAISEVTAPGKKDRLLQYAYRQLPYHPERIETATAWTATLARPLVIDQSDIAADAKDARLDPPSPAARKHRHAHLELAKADAEDHAWHIHAYLEQTISSANEKPGNTFKAVVAQPVYNPDSTLAIPEGAILVGTITKAKPARFFGRPGKLRFDFREIKFPAQQTQQVMGTLAGADASKSQNIRIDAEGGVQAKPKNRVIVPLVLGVLASRTLDDDGSVAGNAAVGSNGFGTVGRIVSIAGNSRDLAAAFGFYGVGVSISERWLVRGQNITFVKNTRIDVTTVPGRNVMAKNGTVESPSKNDEGAHKQNLPHRRIRPPDLLRRADASRAPNAAAQP
ncbi:MAG: hypothetical protein ACRD4Q_14990, partial [Candidatus Acidiferrales bacterium]